MSEGAAPNGLDNTDMQFHKLTEHHYGLISLEVVPAVMTSIKEGGTEAIRYYGLEMRVQRLIGGEQLAITVAVPEGDRDAIVAALQKEHFPDQPCTHKPGHAHA